MSCTEKAVLFLVFICFFIFGSRRIQASVGISPEEAADLEKQLKLLNKPYVKSMKDDYGNIFDCVDIYKQPAFDHPLLKNHTIQIPNITFAEKIVSKSSTKEEPSFGFKESCPSGTVLIRRTTLEDLTRARKDAQYFHAKVEKLYYHSGPLHRAFLILQDIKYYGARAEMQVYSHQVSNNQSTGAQVIVTKGERGPENQVMHLQFGWRIQPKETGDNLIHFFTLWTSDGFQKTGCMNLLCPGFVQLSKRTTPGIVLQDKSVIKLYTYKVPNTGNWVLAREDNDYYELIGYWPKEIFNNFADTTNVQMGGVAYSPLDEPSPPMGNGLLPYQRFPRPAQFKHVQLLRENGVPASLTEVSPFFHYDRKLGSYYKAGWDEDGDVDTFQYGGPGGWKGIGK